jgi:hypothetical protein
MKKPREEKPTLPTDNIRGDLKPLRYEAPVQRPKPTPKPPKKK